MLETTTRESLASADIAHLIHQLTRAGQHARTGPVIVESASGATLRLADGREILDGTSGLWCVNVGHGRAEMADAAAAQMRRLAFAHTASGFSHQTAIELAARLASLTPGDLTAAYFTSGGAEATETSFKFARYYWRLQGLPGKSIVLSHVRGYHGLTHGAASATGLTEYHGIFGDLAEGFDKVPPPYPYRWDEYGPNDIDADGIARADAVARRIEELGPERVAAVIMEPVLGTGGVIVPPDGYFRAVREVCDRYDVLMIADEVITGFGRTGAWFGSQRDDVVPDMMTFAKGVTSGYLPLGGVMLREHLRDAMREAPGDPPLMHVFTYSGHPVPCAVALANLDILERGRRGWRAGQGPPPARALGRAARLSGGWRNTVGGTHGRRGAGARPRHQGTLCPQRATDRRGGGGAGARAGDARPAGRHHAVGPALDRQRRADRPGGEYSGGVHHRHTLTGLRLYDGRHGPQLPRARFDR